MKSEIKTKGRQVNIEALRIVAMLMVCALHVNFTVLGMPSQETCLTFNSLFSTFCEFICIVAVNSFVMISGWFGIRLSLKGFCKFMWQVIWIVGFVFCLGVIFGEVPVDYKTILQIFGLYGGGGWFVAAYLGLYIIAPMLNSFIEKHSCKYVAKVLVAFFIFEILLGCTSSVKWILGGVTTFSFIGIYVLAALLKKLDLKYSASFYLIIFFCSVILNTIIFIVSIRIGSVAIRDITLEYINPLVIIGAASLFMAFYRMPQPKRNITNRLVLFFANSSFAVYLLHVGTPFALGFYGVLVKYIYNSYLGMLSFVAVVGFIVSVFLFAVIIDQPRKLIWSKVLMPIFNRHG